MVNITGGNLFVNPQELIVKSGVIESMNVGDLGCGSSGHFIVPFSKAVGPKGKIYAVDIQKTALSSIISVAKMNLLTNVETVWSNLETVGATKIPAESLDIALLINIMFQNKNHTDIIKEAIRLLKSGGKLIIADWKKIALPIGPPIELRVDKEEIKKLGISLKLNLIEDSTLGDNHFMLIFQK
jgi:ubiquinone/menaquinone biosynthesis C-methylase UbiE